MYFPIHGTDYISILIRDTADSKIIISDLAILIRQGRRSQVSDIRKIVFILIPLHRRRPRKPYSASIIEFLIIGIHVE